MSPLVAPLRAMLPVAPPEMTPLETWTLQPNRPMQEPTLTPAQFPSNDPRVAACPPRRGGWLARPAGFLATRGAGSSSPPETDLSRWPIVPPVLPACANAAPMDDTDIAAAISAIATHVKARIGNSTPQPAMPDPSGNRVRMHQDAASVGSLSVPWPRSTFLDPCPMPRERRLNFPFVVARLRP